MKRVFRMVAEHIANDGAAEGMFEGEVVRVHGMLPKEEGIVEAKRLHGMWIGTLKELHVSSSRRKLPEETHYLSCSPWQIAEYPFQAEEKYELLRQLFAYYDDAPKPTFVPAQRFFGYRTKMEFSFDDHGGALSLAFHARGGSPDRPRAEQGCALASECMNSVALAIVERLRSAGVASRELKTLVVRESKSEGKVLAILYAKNEHISPFSVEGIPGLSGFLAFYSTEKSPASVATRELWRWGSDMLSERVMGMTLGYSFDSFFQNNIPMFERAVTDMSDALAGSGPLKMVELYSGVGTIGLLLGKYAQIVEGVETVPRAVEYARENATANKILNYRADCMPAEKIDVTVLADADVLVLDPPRAGLHPKLVEMILARPPREIIYLSCNPVTQSRDHSLLARSYRIRSITGYDFYPQTPHLESLLVLDRR